MSAPRVVLSAEVAGLLSSMQQGRASFSRETFLEWRRRLSALPSARRAVLKVELLAAARRMVRVGAEQASEAIGQLMALAQELSKAPQRPRAWAPAR